MGKAGLEPPHLASESRLHTWQGLAYEVLCVPKCAHEDTELKCLEARKEPLRGWCILRIPREPSVKKESSIRKARGRRISVTSKPASSTFEFKTARVT